MLKAPAKNIVFHNQKGGVGKTNACVNISVILAEDPSFRKKVLVIDTDVQANATDYLLAFTENPNRATIKEVVEKKKTIQEAIEHVEYPWLNKNIPLYVLPGTHMPRTVKDVDMWVKFNDFTIRDIIDEVKYDYDFIIIDTPPNTTTPLCYSALVAADYVIVPTLLTNDSINGIYWCQEDLMNMRVIYPDINPTLLGVLATMVGRNNKVTGTRKERLQELESNIPQLLFHEKIMEWDSVLSASDKGIPICLYQDNIYGHHQYHNVAAEILYRIKKDD